MCTRWLAMAVAVQPGWQPELLHPGSSCSLLISSEALGKGGRGNELSLRPPWVLPDLVPPRSTPYGLHLGRSQSMIGSQAGGGTAPGSLQARLAALLSEPQPRFEECLSLARELGRDR